MRPFWRCFICGDIHYGRKPPEVCPTCGVRAAYVRVSPREARAVQGWEAGFAAADAPPGDEFTPQEFRTAIEAFADGQEFRVNPDRSRVDLLLEGLFSNAANHGLKYCPCRLRTKDFAEDLKLVCPCPFTAQETYRGLDAGECWCGLFQKRR
jgi:ferredoxin-thioredoxin reductase catalytic chain